MRLLVHALLQCNQPNCGGFPLRIDVCSGEELSARAAQRGVAGELLAVERVPQEFDSEFVSAMLEKIDYEVFAQTATGLGLQVPAGKPTDVEGLQLVHNALLEAHILEARLDCPSCHHVYNVTNGVPDFVS